MIKGLFYYIIIKVRYFCSLAKINRKEEKVTYIYRYDAEGCPSAESVYYDGLNNEDNDRLNQAARCYNLISAELQKKEGVFAINFQEKILEARLNESHCIFLRLGRKDITLGFLTKSDLDLLFGKLSEITLSKK